MSRPEQLPDSEPAIPDDNAPLPPAHRPTSWTVRRGRTITAVCGGLALAVALASGYLTYRSSEASAEQAASANARINVLEQDLAERRQQRDAERDAAAAQDAETREVVRSVLCDILGRLPAGDGLDQARQLLGCPQPGTVPTNAADSAGRPVEPTGGTTGSTSALPTPQPTPRLPASTEQTPPAPSPTTTTPSPSSAPAPSPDPPPSVVCALLPLPLLC